MSWVEKIIAEEPCGNMSHFHYTGEEIIRCRDCKWFKENATPDDDVRPHFCKKLGIDLKDGNGFCSWGERKDGR